MDLFIFNFRYLKKRITKWKILFWITVIVLPFSYIIAVFLTPPQYDGTYLGELQIKIDRLSEIEEEKIIIVGGSSVAFGVRSDLLEKELHMPVVNFGLYAPLGSKNMLEACFDEIREGDIVVFSPEQNRETLSFSFQSGEMWKAMDGQFSMLRIFSEEELKQLIGAFPSFAVSKLKYVVNGKPDSNGIYQQASFDEYGDVNVSGREQNQMPEQYDPTMTIDFSFFPEQDFLAYLNEYAERVRKKGAEFYYRFCPMNKLAIVNEEQIDSYVETLQKEAEYSVLGNPHNCVMDSGWFYDTNFHLNSSGAIINSYYFIRDLKAQLHDSTKTEIELPHIPPFASPQLDGNDVDEDCFIFEEQGNGFYIIGISEEGKNRKELFVPQHHQGKIVLAVQEGSFKNSNQLEDIWIYGKITLFDGCFSGCESLSRIFLSAEPSDIIVGKNLLEGSDAMMFTESASDYYLDYSWGIYSERIREKGTGIQ